MSYIPYATPEYYHDCFHGNAIPDDVLEKHLTQASHHVDSLTYNRIVGEKISSLTEFQQNIVRDVVCQQAEFEYSNKDIFDMILQGYSVNGVSMQFGNSWNVTTQKGIPMRRDLYEQLSQTGLCCRLLR